MGYAVSAPDVVIRQILPPTVSVNHSAPSGPAAIPLSEAEVVLPLGTLTAYSVNTPDVVIRPIFPVPDCSVNQSAPSGPAAIALGLLKTMGIGNSVIVPDVVIRPILPVASVNQIAPSGPATIPPGVESEGEAYFVITPDVVIRPIAECPTSANQRAPSGPAAMPTPAPKFAGFCGQVQVYRLSTPDVVIRPMSPVRNHNAPSGPAAIALPGCPPGALIENCVIVCALPYAGQTKTSPAARQNLMADHTQSSFAIVPFFLVILQLFIVPLG
jgi:hypothetical protein